MGRILLLIGMLVVCSQRMSGQDWELVWHDEFDVDGVVDKEKWGFEHGFVRNHEYQWYQEDNAYIKDGILMLEGRLDSVANPRYDSDSRNWKQSREYAKYTSASINTRGKFSFKYGRLEVRARIPAVMGSWPAIWTLGNDMPWPSNGEIDVMEYYHVGGVPHILANMAWGNDRPNQAVWNSKRIPYSHFLEKDPYWNEKFHVWVMEWDEDEIRLYLDDELLNSQKVDDAKNGRIGRYEHPFRQPHYILLNLAIGGDNGGKPQADAFPMRYEVDYVRVYEMKNEKLF